MSESKSSQMLLFSLTGRHDSGHWFMAGLLCKTTVRLWSVSQAGVLRTRTTANPSFLHTHASRGEAERWVSVHMTGGGEDQSTEQSSEKVSPHQLSPSTQTSNTNQRRRGALFLFTLWLHDWASTAGSMLNPKRIKSRSEVLRFSLVFSQYPFTWMRSELNG